MKNSRKVYRHQYYIDHKEIENKQSVKWRKENPERSRELTLRWLNEHPWITSYRHAKDRCNNPKSTFYRYYGGRGIQFLLTVDEVKQLWLRDKAYSLKQPSIDRKNNDRDYVYNNCRFIEQSENSKKMHRDKKKRLK